MRIQTRAVQARETQSPKRPSKIVVRQVKQELKNHAGGTTVSNFSAEISRSTIQRPSPKRHLFLRRATNNSNVHAVDGALIRVKSTILVSGSFELLRSVLDPVLAEILCLVVTGDLYRILVSISRHGARHCWFLDQTYSAHAFLVFAVEVLVSPPGFGLNGFVWCDRLAV